MSDMSDHVIHIQVSPEARARVLRAALTGRLGWSKMTAGQRRAVEASRRTS